VSATEAVGVEDFTTAEDVASAVAVVSSRASPSSSESLRMITLPSSSGPRRSQLRSPNSRQANSVSREVSTKKSSSSEDEESSITGMFPEGPPCSNTSERGRHEEISDGDLMVVETQTALAVESWRRWVKGACYISCPPLLASREQGRETLSEKRKNAR
jgi:hypothetical protein